MSEITAKMISELRQTTGAGMMDCKKALVENNGDFEKAVSWLRTKGLAAASKKEGRATAEGLVGVKVSGDQGVMVEVNAETDFVSRNDKFQALVEEVLDLYIANSSLDTEGLKASKTKDGKTVNEKVVDAIATIGENMNLRRNVALKLNGDGVIAHYIHNNLTPTLGKIGVMVALESACQDKAKLNDYGRKIAMHIAATKPASLNVEALSPDFIAKEKEIFIAQSKESGKPDSIIEKMIEGRMRKYYEEVVLLEQVFVMDGKLKIKELLEQIGNELGSPVTIKDYKCFVLGEGVKIEEKDFAAEVNAMIK